MEKSLRPCLVTVRLAQDLGRIGIQLGVFRPGTINNVIFNKVPVAAVVSRVLRLGVAVPCKRPITILVSRPDKPVRLRMEPEDLCAEGVRRGRRGKGIPGTPVVRRCVEFIGVRDEIRSV